MIEMYPEQIARHWGALKSAVEKALPPVTRVTMDRMNSIFQALMAGKLAMHLFTTDSKERLIRAVMTTAIIDTVDMCERNLLIYSVFGYGGLSLQEIKEGYDLLVKYAKGNRCTSITGFTSAPTLIAYIKSVGGQADQTFCRLEV